MNRNQKQLILLGLIVILALVVGYFIGVEQGWNMQTASCNRILNETLKSCVCWK